MSQYHGLGRLSIEEIEEGITADLQLVEDYFDGYHHQQSFVMGEKASSADCTVFAFLLLAQRTILAQKKGSESPFNTVTFPNCEAYVRRMEAAFGLYFPQPIRLTEHCV